MPARAHAFGRRFLPSGWLDVFRQLALFGGAYGLYSIVRGLVDGRASQAFQNARELVEIERGLGLFVEPAVNAWAGNSAWLIDSASWIYINSHFTVTFVTLVWIYLYRNSAFCFVRNMFMIAMATALVVYVAFPTAPPRFMPEWGFVDSVAGFTGVTADSGTAAALVNPFAAVPSMHVAFALMLSVTMSRITSRRASKWLWSGYPLLVSFVVVATANHWWLDAVFGACTAAIAAWAAHQLVRTRPQVWAFRVAPHGAPA